MSPLAELFLFAHVLGAIAVFGPTFIFPLIGSAARRAPQHGHFAAELAERIETKIVIPGAVVQGLTGLGLMATLGLDVTSTTWRWLLIGIALYLVAIVYAVMVLGPAATRMVELTGAMSGPPPAGAPAGPPPEIAATAKKLQQGGMLLTTLIVLIVLLMVTKPTIGS
ncbi:MAG: DUF2269 family protein [Chloroflexi bacterium]|nr:DUF2269 family protein [Chloroflexota bacterium]